MLRDRRELVLRSANHYEWLVAAVRRARCTAKAATVVVDALCLAEMDPGHAHLDELLK